MNTKLCMALACLSLKAYSQTDPTISNIDVREEIIYINDKPDDPTAAQAKYYLSGKFDLVSPDILYVTCDVVETNADGSETTVSSIDMQKDATMFTPLNNNAPGFFIDGSTMYFSLAMLDYLDNRRLVFKPIGWVGGRQAALESICYPTPRLVSSSAPVGTH